MKRVLSPQAIRRAVRRVASEIDRDFDGCEVHLLGVLKGSFLFLADLARELRTPCTFDFVRLSSYGSQTTSTGTVREELSSQDPLCGRHVVVVEEIVDSGLTLFTLLARLEEQNPASLSVCTLIDKTERRECNVPVRYRGVTVKSGFLVGYGLDFDEKHRNLPGVYELREEATRPPRKEQPMAVWTCPTCNYEKDSRCKPKKCPECDKAVDFAKKDEAPAKPKKK